MPKAGIEPANTYVFSVVLYQLSYFGKSGHS